MVTIRLANTWANANFYFEKASDRGSWDFPLVSVASAIKNAGDRIDDARIVCGAVQCIPRRLQEVESMIRGKTQSEDTAVQAGSLAIQGAEPLDYNHFKIPLMENLVKRAVRG